MCLSLLSVSQSTHKIGDLNFEILTITGSNMNDNMKRMEKKRESLFKLYFVTSAAYMNAKTFISLKADKKAGQVIDWIHSSTHKAVHALYRATTHKASASHKDFLEDLDEHNKACKFISFEPGVGSRARVLPRAITERCDYTFHCDFYHLPWMLPNRFLFAL